MSAVVKDYSRAAKKTREKAGLACAVRLVLEQADRPLTANEVADRLEGRYRRFSIVSMVEWLDERCTISSFRLGGLLGCWVYTLHGKVAGLKAAGVLPEVQVWPVPDLRATLEDLDPPADSRTRLAGSAKSGDWW